MKVLEKPQKLIHHRDVRVDPFYWMCKRDHPKLLSHLKSENRKTAQSLKPTKALEKTLYKELKGRVVKDESSVPVKKADYYYYVRYKKNQDHPLYCRKKGSLKAKEDIYLDVNKLKKSHKYLQVTSLSLRPDHNMVSFALDTVGRLISTLYFKDLKTGKILKTKIENTTGNHVWAEDGNTLFYVDQNKQTLRHDKVYRFDFKKKTKTLVYYEKNETFRLVLEKSKTKKYIFMHSLSTDSSEMRYIESSKPQGRWKVFQKRRSKLEYYVSHAGEGFFVMNNLRAKNFKISYCQEKKTGLEHWKTWWPHHKKVFIESVESFKDFLVLETKEKGMSEVHVIFRKNKKKQTLKFKEKAYVVNSLGSYDYDTFTFRYTLESLSRPSSVFSYHVKTQKSTLKKKKKVLGGFRASSYETERIFAKSHDGTLIPMSLVYKKGLKRNRKNPTLLYGYGSYGISVDPYFSSARLSLLDRGFIFAMAHVRGGSEMGRSWYEDGRQMKKKNTFYDFISCGEHLIKKHYTSPEHLYGMGASAGGLLIGAVGNMRPDLFRALVASVPFVDCVTTMLDDRIPLTTMEYEEWGDPHKKSCYQYIKSYSPYDNVKAQKYPHFLILSGYHDSQVQYWEPTKWAAKLEKFKTSDTLVLLKTHMSAGHFGSSGRWGPLKETALIWAFLIGLEKGKL